jgi:tetratricopeptide (TPR) repeat protein
MVAKKKTRAPLLTELYEQYLENRDTAGFAAGVAMRYSSGTLQRLASHEQRETRRAATLALGYLGDYEANHTMGRALLDDDRTVRTLAENGIRSLWNRAGNAVERRELAVVIRLNAAQHYAEACRRASALIERAAWYAEAWNQRGVAQFHLEHFTEAIRDCHQALELNPYHFSAAATMGQAYLKLGNQISALESFRRALRLNPDLEGVRAHVVRLARMVDGK